MAMAHVKSWACNRCMWSPGHPDIKTPGPNDCAIERTGPGAMLAAFAVAALSRHGLRKDGIMTIRITLMN